MYFRFLNTRHIILFMISLSVVYTIVSHEIDLYNLFSGTMMLMNNQSGDTKNMTSVVVPGNAAVSESLQILEKSATDWKMILFWESWSTVLWNESFVGTTATELLQEGCPKWKCNVTMDRSYAGTADAIILPALGFRPSNLPRMPRPQYQRWVFLEMEPPTGIYAVEGANNLRAHNMSHIVNWTMTYHSESDIVGFYGFFLSLGTTVMPLRPNLMSQHGEAMRRYKTALEQGDTLEKVMGPSWRSFVKRPRVVAWMSSHCPTNSRREEYVAELSKYITVDKYGACGDKECKKYSTGPLLHSCWKNVITGNYSFYLSMENNLCDEYITEKVYNAFSYNLVPVVWGGSDYAKFLPPHSYINARHYHPQELARLLTRLHQDPVAYGRYHLWRGYFQVMNKGNLCELCYRLHTDTTSSYHTDISEWRMRSGRCLMAPSNMFNKTLGMDSWRSVIYSHYENLTNVGFGL
nr:alpha-(1,3)-fucosyltransferase C-like [Cherax quadricarinatus]